MELTTYTHKILENELLEHKEKGLYLGGGINLERVHR